MNSRKRTPLEPGRGYEIRGGTFEDQIVTIGAGDFVDCITGGAVFRDCELRILSAPRQSLNFHATFIDCDIRPSKPLRNKQIADTTFIGCRFFGQYVGCEFGPKMLDSLGRIENCDFSNARLSLSEIFGAELETLKLPEWPHVYLLYGKDLEWTLRLSDDALPGRLLSLMRLPRGGRVTPRSILSVHLPSDDYDPDVIWPLIQDIPEIWFPSKATKAKAIAADISKAISANSEALAQRKRTLERTTLFGNLHRSWLKSVKRLSDAEVVLVFDCSFLQQRVPDAPAEILVRLHRGSARLRLDGAAIDLDGDLDRFMLMGVGEEGDEVVLKPHRKERGQILLTFQSLILVDDQGCQQPQEAFLNVVKRYYGLSDF